MASEISESTTSADGIIRSGVATAYEEGIDSFGDAPPVTKNEQVIYCFNKPTLRTDVVEAFESSPDINKTRIQNIASMTIAPDEINYIIELLKAKSLEDTLDLAIINKIITKAKEDETTAAALTLIRDQFSSGIADSLNILRRLMDIIQYLDATEKGLAKGNFFAACNNFFKTSRSNTASLLSFSQSMISKKNFEPSWYLSRFLANESDGGYGDFDVLKRLSLATGISESILGTKTISTILMQAFYDAHIKIDFGISPRLMETLKNLPRLDTSSIYYGGGSSSRDYPSHIISAKKYLVSGPSSSNNFKTLYEIFKGGTTSHSQKTSAWSNPGAISLYDLDFGGGGASKSNPLNQIPKVCSTLNPAQQITYLSSIICTEMRSSLALGRESSPAVNDNDGPFGSTGGFSSLKQGVGETKPFVVATGQTLGKKIFDARRYETIPVSDYTSVKPTFQSYASLVFGGFTASSVPSSFSPAIMPFENSTSSIDTQDNKNRIGACKSYKTGILDKFKGSTGATDLKSVVNSLRSMIEEMSTNTDVEWVSKLVTGTGGSHSSFDSDGTIDGNFGHCESNTPESLRAYLSERTFSEHIIQSFFAYCTSSPEDPDKTWRMIAQMSYFFKSSSTAGFHENFLRKIFFKRMSLQLMKHRSGDANNPSPLAQEGWGGLTFGPDFEAEMRNRAEVLGIVPGIDGTTLPSSFSREHWHTLGNDANFLSSDEKKGISISIFSLFTNMDSSSSSAINSAIEVSSTTTSPVTSGYAGHARACPGYDVYNGIVGNSTAGKGLMNWIVDFVDTFLWRVQSLAKNESGNINENGLYPNGCTRANGMDAGHLLGYVFEIFCLLSETLFDAKFYQYKAAHKLISKNAHALQTGYTEGQVHDIYDFSGRTTTGDQAIMLFGVFDQEAANDYKYTIIPSFFSQLGYNYGVPSGVSVDTDWTIDKLVSALNVLFAGSTGGIMARGSSDSQTIGRRISNSTTISNYIKSKIESASLVTDSMADQLIAYTGGFGSTGGLGRYNGSNVSLLDFFYILPDGSSEMSYSNEVLSPALSMINHWSYNISGITAYSITSGGSTEDLSAGTDARIDDMMSVFEDSSLNIPDNYFQEQSVRSVYFSTMAIYNLLMNLNLATGESLQAVISDNGWSQGASAAFEGGYDLTKQNPTLDKAAIMYLQSLDNSKTQNIFFFGVPPNVIDNHLLSLVADDHTKTLTNSTTLNFTVSANKSSEFAEELKFTPNFERKKHTSSIIVTEASIWAAFSGYEGNPIATNFNDLVRYAMYAQITPGSGYSVPAEEASSASRSLVGSGYASTTGYYGYEIEDNGLEEELRSAMESFILKYIFRRVTRLSIDENNLTYANRKEVNMGALRSLIRDIVQPTLNTINEALTFASENADHHREQVVSALNTLTSTYGMGEFTVEDIEQLFASETGESGTTLDDGENALHQFDVSKLKKLLEPQAKREGNTVYLEEPKIKKLEQILAEIFSHSYFAMGSEGGKKILLSPKIFDVVLAVNFADLANDFSVVESSIPDSYTENIEANSLGDPESTGGNIAVLTDALNGIVTVDNFTFTIETNLSS